MGPANADNSRDVRGLSLRKKLIFVFVLLLIFAGILELGVRLLIPQYPFYPRYLYQADPYMGFRFSSNFSGRLQHQDFDVSIKTSSLGFRDQEVETPKTKFRVVGLGDSLTMGLGVEAEDIYWSQIERRFKNIEIVNTGMGATGTLQQLALYEHYARPLHPDLVVLLFSSNDPDDSMEGLSRTVRAGYNIPTSTNWPFLQVSLNYVADHWATFHLVAERAMKLSGIYALLRDSKRVEVTAEKGTPRKTTYTQELLDKLYASVSEDGARFAVIFANDQWIDEFSPWLSSKGIPWFGLESHLKGEKDITFPHDGHWNARGHTLVAAAVAEFLLKSGLIPESAASGSSN